MVGKRRTVLIVHPEGSFNSNPTLAALIHELCDRGVHVVVASPSRKFSQESTHSNMDVVLYPLWKSVLFAPVYFVGPLLQRFLRPLVGLLSPAVSPAFILGVDREGIILAALLAKRLGVPYGLVSFEIFFREELGLRKKLPEIEACGSIDFALVQDPFRGKKLSEQNGIPAERLMYAPVAGSGIQHGTPGYLRRLLAIPEGTKIALAIGSTDPWTLLPDLIDTTPAWPDDWCLVIHQRFGRLGAIRARVAATGARKVVLSSAGALPAQDLGLLLGDADIGVAFYRPSYNSRYHGLNLRFLGYSSGKISTYLQYGIPVLTNNIGPLAEDMLNAGVGLVAHDLAQVPGLLASFGATNVEMSKRCHEFFETKLDGMKTLPPVVERILQAMERQT